MARRKSKKAVAAEEVKLISVMVECGWCGHSDVYLPDMLEWKAGSVDCELCGSHGEIELGFKCKVCKKQNWVELRSW